METPQATEHEPTLVDLAERLDTEGMVGFTRAFHDDLRRGFEAVNPERYPWMDDLRKAPWSGVLCLGMGGAPQVVISRCLTEHEEAAPCGAPRLQPTRMVQRHVVGAGDQPQRQHRRNGGRC